ncbi:MAG: ABC transporter ATP-binding protein [Candidatus Latescibacteria bacterium]|nr:ABC transporter ATP-binding protein [Candidatus Latescibacterota bacterium]
MDTQPIILASTPDVPPLIRDRMKAANVDGQPVLLAVEGDLNEHGQLTPVWLIVMPDRVVSVPAAQADPIIGPFTFGQTEEFRLRGTVGSSSLQAMVDGLHIDLIRFTNTHRERFQRVLTQLKLLKENQALQPQPLTDPDPRFCQTCGLILPSPNSPCPRCVKQGAILRRTLRMLRGSILWVLVLVGLMVAGIGLDLLPPFLMRILVDDVLTSKKHTNWLLWLVLGLAGASLLRAAVNILIGRLSTFIGTRITYDVRRQLFDKLQQMSVDYYDRMEVGRLMTRCLSDVDQLQGFVNQAAQGFLINILLIVSIGGMMFSLNPRLAVYVLIPIPFVIGGTVFFWKRIYPKYFKLSDSQSKLTSALNSILSGIRLVKAFAQEEREARRFTHHNEYARDARRRVEMSAGTFSPLMAFVFGLGGLIIWYVGGRDVLGNKISLGTLMMFLGYLGMFYGPLSNLTQLSNWLTSFMTSSQRVFEILDTDPGLHDNPKAVKMPALRGEIEFDHIVFGYDPYNAVIKDVSFTIEAGRMIGIVGRSGSGKSTLINLLCRFYDVQEGAVRIDGVDVRNIRREDLHRHIGLVLQEPFLFRASVAENIAYGKPDATFEEIMNAAKAANAHDFIMRLPAGYDTRLGERGAGLSGGERQRVSIARALLCNPAILILDEATSSVDTESEQQIQEALTVLCKGRTTIAIAHRLSTLRGADCIYVIDNGRLAEFGSHTELMRQEGIYHRLVQIQTQLASLETQ